MFRKKIAAPTQDKQIAESMVSIAKEYIILIDFYHKLTLQVFNQIESIKINRNSLLVDDFVELKDKLNVSILKDIKQQEELLTKPILISEIEDNIKELKIVDSELKKIQGIKEKIHEKHIELYKFRIENKEQLQKMNGITQEYAHSNRLFYERMLDKMNPSILFDESTSDAISLHRIILLILDVKNIFIPYVNNLESLNLVERLEQADEMLREKSYYCSMIKNPLIRDKVRVCIHDFWGQLHELKKKILPLEVISESRKKDEFIRSLCCIL